MTLWQNLNQTKQHLWGAINLAKVVNHRNP